LTRFETSTSRRPTRVTVRLTPIRTTANDPRFPGPHRTVAGRGTIGETVGRVAYP
jgi:hypothetical protein